MVLVLALRLLTAAGSPFDAPADRVLALSAAFPAVVWLTCRRGRPSFRTLRVVEGLGLLGCLLCLAVMGRYDHAAQLAPGSALLRAALDPGPLVATTEAQTAATVTLAASYAALLRAALVPSRPRYTFALTAALGVPLALVWLPNAAHFGATHLTLMSRAHVSSTAVSDTAAWWLVTSLLCTALSAILLGLRRQIAEARRLGQYALEQRLGEGALGTVYRARHPLMHRPTAIKVLARARVPDEQMERIERDVELATQLTHPSSITIFDHGRAEQGQLYYVMELLDGATVDEIVAVGNAQPPERVVHTIAQVAAALVEAHDLGLLHRDVKPSNVMLSSLGGQPDVAKLLDYGVVAPLATDDDDPPRGEAATTGTPLYRAPEAITAPKSVDERSDLYSLGAVGYFLLTGEHVFDGATAAEICGQHLHDAPEPPAERLGRHVPEELERLLLDLLAKEPAERPPTARALLERLTACDGYGRWSEEQAREWWEEHEAAILRLRGRPRPTRGLTLTKALDRADG